MSRPLRASNHIFIGTSCARCPGIAIALNGNFGGHSVQLLKIGGREFDASRSDVLPQSMQSCGAGNRNDPRLLGEQPCERYLGRCGTLPLSKRLDDIDQTTIRLESLGREPREGATVIVRVELCLLCDRSGEISLSERTVGNEADAQFLECGPESMADASSGDGGDNHGFYEHNEVSSESRLPADDSGARGCFVLGCGPR